MRAQPAPDAVLAGYAPPGAGEHAFGGDRGRAGGAAAEHPRVGASPYEVDLAGNVRRLRDALGNDLGGYRYTAFGELYPADATTPAPVIDQPLQWKGRWFSPLAGWDLRREGEGVESGTGGVLAG
jgi:hypothetical protein